ncbi:cytochrome P450 [Streptomyces sp. NPDC000594]|uniref:cytochrome P450 n=1 Tax=Streptomyces sp. NPDC000594 TaxID=3154261 RepID=UPI00332010E3
MTAQTPRPPEAPGALPLLGHTLAMKRRPLDFVSALPELGEVVRIRLGPVGVLLVCDPDLTHEVLLDPRTFDKGGFIFDRAREYMGDNLATCPHSAHLRQRRLTQPAFHISRLPGYAGIMADAIDETAAAWRDGAVVDPVADLMALTAKVILRTMFSWGLSDRSLSDAVGDLVVVVDGTYWRSLVPPAVLRVPLPANRRFDRAHHRLSATFLRIIQEYRADGTDRGDLLSILLATRDEGDGGGMSDTEISNQLFGFFLAGTETTATLLAWTLHALTERPELQERLHAEIDTVLGGRPPGFDDLEALDVTRRILTESLRHYTPVWMLTRVTTTDTRIGPYEVPAGTTLMYSPYIVHHLPSLYPDPHRFDPDRWAPGEKPPRRGFLPFAVGSRKCIGDAFALTEATLALATIAQRWRWSASPGARVRPTAGAAIRPQGMRLRFTARPQRPVPHEETADSPVPSA